MLSDESILAALRLAHPSAHESYASRLRQLSKILGASIYEILKSPDVYAPRVERAYEKSACSRTNAAAAVVAAFRALPELSRKKPRALGEWRAWRAKFASSIKEREASISREQIEAKYRELSANPHADAKSSMRYVLLSAALHMRAPKRFDYGSVAIVFAPEKTSPSPDYVYIRGKGDAFAVIGGRRQRLDRRLAEDIAASVKRYPRAHLFVGSDGRPFEKTNTYNVFVLRAFEKMFGKRVGAAQLAKVSA